MIKNLTYMKLTREEKDTLRFCKYLTLMHSLLFAVAVIATYISGDNINSIQLLYGGILLSIFWAAFIIISALGLINSTKDRIIRASSPEKYMNFCHRISIKELRRARLRYRSPMWTLRVGDGVMTCMFLFATIFIANYFMGIAAGIVVAAFLSGWPVELYISANKYRRLCRIRELKQLHGVKKKDVTFLNLLKIFVARAGWCLNGVRTVHQASTGDYYK